VFYIYDNPPNQGKQSSFKISRYTDGSNFYLSGYGKTHDDVVSSMTVDRDIGYIGSSVFDQVIAYSTGSTNSYYLTTSKFAGESAGYQMSKRVMFSVAPVSGLPYPVLPDPLHPSPPSTLPASFNALDNWNLRGVGVLHQQQCGSCYAFTSSVTLTYRGMIAGYPMQSNGIVSPQAIFNCGAGLAYPQSPCDGGYIGPSMQLPSKGLTTCSPLNGCSSGCRPYAPSLVRTDACPNTCVDGTAGPLLYGTNVYDISPDKEAIKQELYLRGPIAAAFDFYQSWIDFTRLRPTSVYGPENKYVSEAYVGSHGAVLVGWGSDASGDYWIFQNSWGSGWGDKGFFYVRAGYDLFRIETFLVATRYSTTIPLPVKKKREVKEAKVKTC